MLSSGIETIQKLNDKIYEITDDPELCLNYITDSYSDLIQDYFSNTFYSSEDDDLYNDDNKEIPVVNILMKNINKEILRLSALERALAIISLEQEE